MYLYVTHSYKTCTLTNTYHIHYLFSTENIQGSIIIVVDTVCI